ncbi:MAG: O-antigen ligase family protein [Panacagrimonas sp.]
MSDRRFGWLMALFLIAPYCLCLIQFNPNPPVVATSKPIEPSSLFRNGWMAFIVLSAFVMALRFRLLTRLMAHVNPWMLAFLAWCFASAMWAPDAAVVLRKSVIITGVTIMAIAFALVAWHPRRFEAVFLPMLLAIVIASIVSVAVKPSYAIHPELDYGIGGTWRGVTAHKNGLGAVSSFVILLVCHAWASRRMSGLKALAGAALGLFTLVMSSSSTSLLLCVMACSLVIGILRPPPISLGRAKLVVAMAIGLTVIPVSVFLFLRYRLELATMVSGWFGKDATFSGRSLLWLALIDEIQKHPWIGIGYASFWNGLGSASDEVMKKVGSIVSHGHNGYLDKLNELGVVGLALLTAMLVRHGRDLARLALVDRSQFALHLGIFVYFLILNCVETAWFSAANAAHVVVVFSSLAVSRQLLQIRLLSQRRPATRSAPPAGTAASDSHDEDVTLPADWVRHSGKPIGRVP